MYVEAEAKPLRPRPDNSEAEAKALGHEAKAEAVKVGLEAGLASRP